MNSFGFTLYKCTVFLVLLYMFWIASSYKDQFQQIQQQFSSGLIPKSISPSTRHLVLQIEESDLNNQKK
jgi:hypothetical protein